LTSIIQGHSSCLNDTVVLEGYYNVFRNGSVEESELFSHQGFCADVVSHVIGEWKVMGGGDKVCSEEDARFVSSDLDPLLTGSVAIDAMNDDVRRYLNNTIAQDEMSVF
jgi:hypothetical protein